jgi:purine-nucleoside phosphorylase
VTTLPFPTVPAFLATMKNGNVSHFFLHSHFFLSWGTRFPDVSEAYNAGIQKQIVAASTKFNISTKSVVATQLVGPIFGSRAQARYAAEINTQVMCTGLVSEVLAARHCKMIVGAIGVVSRSLVDEAKEVEFKGEFVENVEKIIASVVKE